MPDFHAQFGNLRNEAGREYMGGYSRSCGEHPSLPKYHRWSKVRVFKTVRGEFRDRICSNCSLTKGADEE